MSLQHITGDGAVHTGPGWIRSATLAADAGAAATLVLRDGGASGTILLTLTAAAGTTVQARFADASFVTDLYADITGASAAAAIEI